MERTGVAEETVLSMAGVDSLDDLNIQTFTSLMNKFGKTPDRMPPNIPQAPAGFMNVPDDVGELPFV